ncbi:DUF4232 domain-containing protein [Streptomyces sp. NPDC058664]|uniref:DUF4232 domain-containing protein n=1 Tax=unclassified Streptomyces TaxID=2593676 RepID=UPI00365EEE76
MSTHHVSRPYQKSPRGWRPYAVGAAVVAALLASTACQSGATGSAKPTGTPSAKATAKPTDAPSSKPTDKPSAKPTVTRPRGTGSPEPDDTPGGVPEGSTAIVTCTQEQLAVSSELEPPDSKTPRHVLLTVQNVGDKQCNLYRHPHVRLGADARTTVPAIKDSDPDPGRPVTLDPGKEGYAALLVSGGARDEYEAKSITLTLQGGKPGSRAGGPIDVPLPVSTLYADDGQLVTYWTTASGYALDFIMSR